MVARTAAFFDLDKTIIARSSSLAFSRPFYRGGLINRSAMLRSAYAQFVYVLGGADHDQMEKMRASMSELVTGWDVERVKEIVAETLHDLIDPMIYDEAAALIEQHKAEGRDIVIVSSSGTEVVEPIGELLGADDVVATRMVVADGRYTGEIEFYAYAENKAVAMRELAGARTGTTSPSATRTATASPTCRCSTRSAIRSPSTPTSSCARWQPSVGGRSCCSPPRWLCGAGCRGRIG